MKIAVSLINWNNADDTTACLNSLYQGSRVPDHVLVWDNNSHDQSARRIRDAFPNVELYESDKNVGFAAACNESVLLLKKQNADAVWLLNNDTICDKECLTELEHALVNYPEASAVTGKILYESIRDRIWYAGGRVSRFTCSSLHEGQGQLDSEAFNTMKPVEFMSGCSMLINTSCLNQCGLFDPAFFAYCEDLDWSLRVRNAGNTLLYIPSSRLYHKVSSSILVNDRYEGSCSPLQHFLTARNQLFVIRRHARGITARILGLSGFVAQRLTFAGVNLVLGRPKKTWAIVKGLHQGLWFRQRPVTGLIQS